MLGDARSRERSARSRLEARYKEWEERQEHVSGWKDALDRGGRVPDHSVERLGDPMTMGGVP